MSFIIDEGQNNRVIIKNIFSKMHSKIIIKGDNNTIVLDDDVKIRYSKISVVGDNNYCHLHQNSSLKYTVLTLRDASNVSIGQGTTIGNVELIAVESTKIFIGEDCMIAAECELRTSDMHPIYSIQSGERINPAQDILIGNHVWLAKRVMVHKGSRIPNHTTVGAGAIVTSGFEEEYTLLAGVPAKKIKEGIVWGRSTSNKSLTEDQTLKYILGD